jgi:CHAT domain-containing protein
LRARSASERAARADGADPAASLWIVAAPVAPEGLAAGWPALPEIPFGEREAKRLGSAYPKGSVRVLRAERASLEGLREGDLRSADVLHMVVHGLADPLRERPAGLCLAPTKVHDGRLWCEQVDGLREDGSPASALRVPRLVVLASCGAARGPMRYGEDGLNHLGGAFLCAGASCVVLSRQDVDSDYAQLFGERFHARLRLGDSPAESARAAREDLLKEHRAQAWQIGWMQVLGDGQKALFPR